MRLLHTISSYVRLNRDISSGGEPTCTSPEGLSRISNLFGTIKEVGQPGKAPCPDVLPGSGVSPSTVRAVLEALLPLGLRQIHMSGGRWVPGETHYRKRGMGMGVGEGEWAVWRTSEERVREVVKIISTTCDEWAMLKHNIS